MRLPELLGRLTAAHESIADRAAEDPVVTALYMSALLYGLAGLLVLVAVVFA